jgi:hypothetical protein
MPALSAAGREALDRYARYLHDELDLRPATVRNYLSDLRQFAAWCEAAWRRRIARWPSLRPR